MDDNYLQDCVKNISFTHVIIFNIIQELIVSKQHKIHSRLSSFPVVLQKLVQPPTFSEMF
jgi:hypothetical protein